MTLETMTSTLPSLFLALMWGGVAWMMFCRLRPLGPDDSHAIKLGMAITGTGALGQALGQFVAFSAAQRHGIDVATAGGLFLMFLAFAPLWSDRPPQAVRRE